jgi:NAD(P)-dependent dehydrogenase (short-subunit alcohol dehydrogenase family)
MNILIVGGTSGLGQEYAKYCHNLRRSFTIIGRNDSEHFSSKVIHCDLSVSLSVEETVNHLISNGKLFDSIVFFQRSRRHELSEEWISEIDVQVSATRVFLHNADLLLSPTGNRSIVSIGSLASNYITGSASETYHVAKSALLQLMRFHAKKLGPKGIRLNSVSPFNFIKPDNQRFFEDSKEWLHFLNERIPLQSQCTFHDIIAGIEFLLSSKARMITGQNLVIDGGLSLSIGANF